MNLNNPTVEVQTMVYCKGVFFFYQVTTALETIIRRELHNPNVRKKLSTDVSVFFFTK